MPIQMKTYAIIPARGGSKGIPRKNIKMFKDKPLIAHSILQAQEARIFQKIIVSTDDDEIAEVARSYRATILMRPKELAGDLSRDYEFMKHAVENFPECDIWCQLRPTFPLRNVKDITLALTNFKPAYSSLRSVVETEHSVYKTYFILNGDLRPTIVHDTVDESYNAPRQILPKSYQHNGCIDIVKKETIQNEKSITGSKIQPYFMTQTGDIDTIEQWKETELL
tara:strand:- start:32 stop:703 length:672 start_codon:yes stop_codon:yes gene_type:complete